MFIAQKPCSFAGHKFKIGETIPEGMVLPEAVSRLKRCGIIAEVGDAGPLLPALTSLDTNTEEAKKVAVPILADEGTTEVEMTIEELLKAVETIQKDDDEIISDIEAIENEDVLIFIDVMKGAADHIHEAAKARAEAIAAVPVPDNEKELMALTRQQLVEYAQFYGMEVEDKHVKRELAAYILEAQAKLGSDE